MTRLTRDPSLMLLPSRTVRIVHGRDIREIEMGSGAAAWVGRFIWPKDDAEWDRIMRQRAAVNQ